MKVIDLLNKINNREEVPKKIKFNNIEFEYDTRQEEYNHEKENGYYETLLYVVMNTHFISSLLRAEVEVVEEKKEIDTINAYKLIEAPYLADCLKEKKFDEVAELLKQSELEIVERVNDLVHAIEKLIEEREGK